MRFTPGRRLGVLRCHNGSVAIDQAMPDPSAEWWTTSEVAAYLGLRIATVSSYRMRGRCQSQI
jgi:hypothetical protein